MEMKNMWISMLAGLGAIFSFLVVAEAKFVNNELDHLMDFPLERDDVATECDLYLARETWRWEIPHSFGEVA